MGTLIARHYSTPLFANQADHTYVECGTGGKAWGCWGGKTGGAELRRAPGATRRADRIAGPKERAGITCYLINGVCHQAANRILLPAGITVRGARGYGISEALFGTYGRLLFWPCRAPFRQHPGVSGDLAECSEAPARPMRVAEPRPAADQTDWNYIQGVLSLYRRAEEIRVPGRLALTLRVPKSVATALGAMQAFHLELFRHMTAARLGPETAPALLQRLLRIRRAVERERADAERAYSAREIAGAELAKEIDSLARSFQERMANTLTAVQYQSLFDLKPGEWVTLADQEIVRTALRR